MITLDTTYFYVALVLLPLAGMLLATWWINKTNLLIRNPILLKCHEAFYTELDVSESVLYKLNNSVKKGMYIDPDIIHEVTTRTLHLTRIMRAYLVATRQLPSSPSATTCHQDYVEENPYGK